MGDPLTDVLDQCWRELGFGAKLASHTSGVLSGLVTVPTCVLVGVLDVVEAPMGVLYEVATNLPDRMKRVYNGGRKLMAEASGVNPESPTWEKDFSELSWWRRGLACLVGCLSALVDVPIYVAGGFLRATATFVSKVVTLPGRILVSAGNAYNYGKLVSIAHSSSDENLNDIVRAIETSHDLKRTQQLLGLDNEKFVAFSGVLFKLREERAELKLRTEQSKALEAAKLSQLEADKEKKDTSKESKKANGKPHKHELALNPA
jgi:hypothetical protein